MHALDYWKAVVMDSSDFLQSIIGLLDETKVRYCIIGGQGVNAYAEPVVSLDLDIAIVLDDLSVLVPRLERDFDVKRFPHSVNVSAPGSDLRVQFQTDPRYASFADRGEVRRVLGLRLPVASAADVMKGKVWAVQDPGRRPSKRQKDLADISRLLEVDGSLRALVPTDVLERLYS